MGRFCELARSPAPRSLAEFAESEIVLPPGGPFGGERFRPEFQPFARLWLEAHAQAPLRGWTRFVFIGPAQGGKTFLGLGLPVMWHLFELRETVVLGVPDLGMASDKWNVDLRPIIERSRFRDLMPTSGSGSRGGEVDRIQFAEGQVCRFMTGGARDAGRAGFAARVAAISEVDKMSGRVSTSEESDKISQIEARTGAFSEELGQPPMVYLECTVSIEEGRIWQEYQRGTASRILTPCPHCGHFVAVERMHLIGWKDATEDLDARQAAHFVCPDCGHTISRAERRAMNAAGVLAHRGQTVRTMTETEQKADPKKLEADAIAPINGTDQAIVGPIPHTSTFGFRFSGFHNMFKSPGDLGVLEWRGARRVDIDEAERDLCQNYWALPYKPRSYQPEAIDPQALSRRSGRMPRGVVPPDARWITIGLDLGKYLAHYAAIAWTPGAGGQVIDYGRFDVPSKDLGLERALLQSLREFRDRVVLAGYAKATGGTQQVDQVWIDAGYQRDPDSDESFPVYQFCRESGGRFMPTKGAGAGRYGGRTYSVPKSKTGTVLHISEGYHLVSLPAHGVALVYVNADHWKTFIHRRLNGPPDSPGSVTLFAAPPHEHTSFVNHLAAEQRVLRVVEGRGEIWVWEKPQNKANHFFDAVTLASAAGHHCGARLLQSELRSNVGSKPAKRPALTTPDGRPFFVLERT